MRTFFFLVALGLCCFAGLSLVAGRSGGYSAAVHRLLTAVASLVGEHRLSTSRLQYLRHVGSVAHQLTYSTAHGIFPAQGLNLCPLHRQADSYPLCHQGSPCAFSEARLDHSLAIEMSTSPSPACLTTQTPSTRPTMFYSLKNKTKARALLMAQWLRICLPVQRIFTTQGLNPGLPYCRQILYRLSPQGSPHHINPARKHQDSAEFTPFMATVLGHPEPPFRAETPVPPAAGSLGNSRSTTGRWQEGQRPDLIVPIQDDSEWPSRLPSSDLRAT